MQNSSIILHRRFRGVVVKLSAAKTIAVRVDRTFRHSRLERVVRREKKFLTHDEKGTAKLGDEVIIEEARPFSRRKRWKLVEVVKSAPSVESENSEDEKESL